MVETFSFRIFAWGLLDAKVGFLVIFCSFGLGKSRPKGEDDRVFEGAGWLDDVAYDVDERYVFFCCKEIGLPQTSYETMLELVWLYVLGSITSQDVQHRHICFAWFTNSSFENVLQKHGSWKLLTKVLLVRYSKLSQRFGFRFLASSGLVLLE